MKKQFLFLTLFLHTGLLYCTSGSWADANGNWSAPGTNWSPSGAVPNAAGDVATLSNAGSSAAHTITLDVAETIGAIAIDFNQTYTVANGGFTLTLQTPSGISTITVTTLNGAAPHGIECPIALNNNLTINQGSPGLGGALTISGGINNGTASAPSLTMQGTGILLPSANNGYSGGTIINGGTIIINADNNLGLAGTTVTMSGGTLEFNGTFGTSRPFSLTGGATLDVTPGNTATMTGLVSGTGSLTLTDTGTLVLSNTSNSYQGGTTISQGTLSISSDANLGNASGSLTIGSAILLTTSGITSARSGSFTGAAVINTSGATDTFTGSFSGSGSLTVQGGGAVVLSGTNSYSGGTTVATLTTLRGNTNGLQGNISLNTASSQLSFNQNFNGTYGGVLTSVVGGAGVVSINGTGAVTFSGNSGSSFTGATNVLAGSLIVTGSIANSSTVTLSPGTLLQGTGTVGPTVSNSATIRPGVQTGTGTLSIHGDLTLNGTSTVSIGITPLTANTLSVSGSASLTGADLTVSPTTGFYGLTTSYTILTSSGLGGTEFNSPTSTNPNFIPTLSYSSNNVILSVRALNPFFDFPFSNRNTESVGNNITALSLAGELSAGLTAVLDLFVGQSFSSINNALDQMHPAPYSALTELQEEMGAKLISLFHRKPYLPYVYLDSTRVWVTPFGDSLNEKHHGEEFGFTANSGGVALGFDRDIIPDLVLGFGAAWYNSHLEWHDHHGHGEVNGIYGSAYLDYQVWNFYLGGAIYAGADLYDTSRHLNFFSLDEHAKASYTGYDIVAQLATAYYFGSPSAFFYPYANFDLLYCHIPHFDEHGAPSLNLSVKSHSASTFRTEMGLALQVIDRNYDDTMGITPLFSIGWVNMCPTERPNYHSNFIGAPISFTTYGWNETWNLFSLDFGLGYYYKAFSIDAEYNVEMSADKETLLYNHYGNISFQWEW